MKKIYFIVMFIVVLSHNSFAATYNLIRTSVMYSNGEVIDSLQSGISISGTMWINGMSATQQMTICVPECTTLSAAASLLTFGENMHSVTVNSDGNSYDIVLLSLSPLMTLVNTDTFAEVDQWIPGGSEFNASEQKIKPEYSNIIYVDGVGTLFKRLMNINQ